MVQAKNWYPVYKIISNMIIFLKKNGKCFSNMKIALQRNFSLDIIILNTGGKNIIKYKQFLTLIIGSVSVLNAEIVCVKLKVNKREYQLFFDQLPNYSVSFKKVTYTYVHVMRFFLVCKYNDHTIFYEY